jgi:hypothetical protein
MTLRFGIFRDDLDAVVDLYSRVLGFSITKDQRGEPAGYVVLQRGSVRVGAARRGSRRGPGRAAAARGAELVLAFDDVAGERDRVVAVRCRCRRICGTAPGD